MSPKYWLVSITKVTNKWFVFLLSSFLIGKKIKNPLKNKNNLNQQYFTRRHFPLPSTSYIYNPGQNFWDTLCFRCGKCNSSWPPSPLNSVGCYKSKIFYLSCKRWGPQLCSGAGRWGKNLVKALFKSVYCKLTANSIQKHVKKGRCPKTFWPGL